MSGARCFVLNFSSVGWRMKPPFSIFSCVAWTGYGMPNQSTIIALHCCWTTRTRSLYNVMNTRSPCVLLVKDEGRNPLPIRAPNLGLFLKLQPYRVEKSDLQCWLTYWAAEPKRLPFILAYWPRQSKSWYSVSIFWLNTGNCCYWQGC